MIPTDGPPFFIRVGDDVYGPYAPAEARGFWREGRLSARTLVSEAAHGPYAAAGEVAWLQRLFLGGEVPGGGPAGAPAGATPGASAPLPLLVIALDGDADGRLATAIETLGASLRLKDGVFVLHTALSASQVRNHVTRGGLGAGGLMALPFDAARAAWFDLPQDLDRALLAL